MAQYLSHPLTVKWNKHFSLYYAFVTRCIDIETDTPNSAIWPVVTENFVVNGEETGKNFCDCIIPITQLNLYFVFRISLSLVVIGCLLWSM